MYYGTSFLGFTAYYKISCIQTSYVGQSVDDLSFDVIRAGVWRIKLSGGINITCVLLDIVLEMASGTHSNINSNTQTDTKMPLCKYDGRAIVVSPYLHENCIFW